MPLLPLGLVMLPCFACRTAVPASGIDFPYIQI